jgi:hypothetical protein
VRQLTETKKMEIEKYTIVSALIYPGIEVIGKVMEIKNGFVMVDNHGWTPMCMVRMAFEEEAETYYSKESE